MSFFDLWRNAAPKLQRSRQPARRARLEVEGLEARQLLSTVPIASPTAPPTIARVADAEPNNDHRLFDAEHQPQALGTADEYVITGNLFQSRRGDDRRADFVDAYKLYLAAGERIEIKAALTNTTAATKNLQTGVSVFSMETGSSEFRSSGSLIFTASRAANYVIAVCALDNATAWTSGKLLDQVASYEITITHGVTATFKNGVLHIRGTGQEDTINVRQDNNAITVEGVKIKNGSNDGRYYPSLTPGNISLIKIEGFGKDDKISLLKGNQSISRPTEIYGGAGSDTIFGAPMAVNKIWGGSGDDRIVGGSKDDWLFGGSDHDVLIGKGGTNDHLRGGSGNDWLEAGSAKELDVDGEDGADWNAHTWVIGGSNMGDIRQDWNNCWFMAPLAAASRMGLEGQIKYLGDFKYQVTLYDPNSGAPVAVEVEFNGSFRPDDPIVTREGEYWTVLYSRAFEHALGGWPANGSKALGATLSILTGRAHEEGTLGPRQAGVKTFSTRDSFAAWIDQALKNGQFVAAGTKVNESLIDFQLTNNHAYAVRSIVRSSVTGKPLSVNLFDPNGQAPGSSDGFITVSWDAFCRSMDKVAVTKNR